MINNNKKKTYRKVISGIVIVIADYILKLHFSFPATVICVIRQTKIIKSLIQCTIAFYIFLSKKVFLVISSLITNVSNINLAPSIKLIMIRY